MDLLVSAYKRIRTDRWTSRGKTKAIIVSCTNRYTSKNTRRCPKVELMLGQRHRRWATIGSALVERLFAVTGIWMYIYCTRLVVNAAARFLWYFPGSHTPTSCQSHASHRPAAGAPSRGENHALQEPVKHNILSLHTCILNMMNITIIVWCKTPRRGATKVDLHKWSSNDET